MQISNTKIYGLEESIYASGYAMVTEIPTEIEFNREVEQIKRDLILGNYVSNKHIKRMFNLGNTPIGSGHDQCLTGIIVQFDLKIPIKMWVEAQRYSFLEFVTSSSTMHKIKDFKLDKSMFNKYVEQSTIDNLNRLQQEYRLNPTEENYMTLLMNAPVGLEIFARMTTNYRQLKTIVSQRNSHALEDWKEFCRWAKRLPYFKEIALREKV